MWNCIFADFGKRNDRISKNFSGLARGRGKGWERQKKSSNPAGIGALEEDDSIVYFNAAKAAS
jgi:hypothetical protein